MRKRLFGVIAAYRHSLVQKLLESVRILGNHSGCHQLPERSFFYHGKQFPVCARCTGVTLGQAGAILAAALKIPVSFGLSVFLLAVMGADWCLQAFRIRESTNPRRLITGICGGFGLFSLYRIAAAKAALYCASGA